MIYVTKTELPPLEKYQKVLRQIWNSGWLTNDGKYVQLLEKRLKAYLEVPYLALMTNGTIALQILYRAFHLKGEVITTPFTFAATATSLLWEGITPVFADIDPETFNISLSSIENRISRKTKAIVAVHVYGNPCDVIGLSKIRDTYQIPVIYDAAHAFGVKYYGKSVLNYGDANVLSFHATKLFNTGEGGAVVTHDSALDGKVRNLRNFGITGEEDSVVVGTNGKMNELSAALGLLNIPLTDERIHVRRRLYERYAASLKNVSGIRFQKITASKYNYAYMPVLFSDKATRDIVHDGLLKIGVKTRKYFYPLVTDQTFTQDIPRQSTPNAHSVSEGILCLPLYSTLRYETVERIASRIVTLLKRRT